MRCPTLAELPAPPAGKYGWPWTIESPQLSDSMPDGKPWPAISIVTPSYNQGEFIEETIRSVLLQGYPDLEYIVIDGGSTDGTVDIIRKYEPWLTFWVSEKDRGQSHAINKGFERATGDIFQWINSDDFLSADALHCVGTTWQENSIIAGGVCNFVNNKDEHELIYNRRLNIVNFIGDAGCDGVFQQPGFFIPLRVAKEYLGRHLVREDFQYIFDWYLMIVILALTNNNVTYVHHVLSHFRLHQSSKTVMSQDKFDAERSIVNIALSRDPITRFMGSTQRSYLANVLARHEISQVVRLKSSIVRRLFLCAYFLSVHPPLLWDRFYWGAIRRIVKPDARAL